MREMYDIPYGETRSYGEIAENIGSAAVAVGQACGKNPIPLIIPCHRVVGKNSIGGYAYGEEVKQKLLELEGADF
jgi:methylated-DNA-[protein]-cysteine S-methyltransferase